MKFRDLLKHAPVAKVARKAFARMTRFDITVEGDFPAQATLRSYQESDGRQRMAFDLVMPPKTFMPCTDKHRDAVALEQAVGLLRAVAGELEKHRGHASTLRIPVVGFVDVVDYDPSDFSDEARETRLARGQAALDAAELPEGLTLQVVLNAGEAQEALESASAEEELYDDDDEDGDLEPERLPLLDVAATPRTSPFPDTGTSYGAIRAAVGAFNAPDINDPPPPSLGLRNEDDL